jgi:hypothetical protein
MDDDNEPQPMSGSNRKFCYAVVKCQNVFAVVFVYLDYWKKEKVKSHKGGSGLHPMIIFL